MHQRSVVSARVVLLVLSTCPPCKYRTVWCAVPGVYRSLLAHRASAKTRAAPMTAEPLASMELAPPVYGIGVLAGVFGLLGGVTVELLDPEPEPPPAAPPVGRGY